MPQSQTEVRTLPRKQDAENPENDELEEVVVEPEPTPAADLLVLINRVTEQEEIVSPAQWNENHAQWTQRGFQPKDA